MAKLTDRLARQYDHVYLLVLGKEGHIPGVWRSRTTVMFVGPRMVTGGWKDILMAGATRWHGSGQPCCDLLSAFSFGHLTHVFWLCFPTQEWTCSFAWTQSAQAAVKHITRGGRHRQSYYTRTTSDGHWMPYPI